MVKRKKDPSPWARGVVKRRKLEEIMDEEAKKELKLPDEPEGVKW